MEHTPLVYFSENVRRKVNLDGLLLPGSICQEITMLTTDNSAKISQHGFVDIQCPYNHEWRNIKFYVVVTAPWIIPKKIVGLEKKCSRVYEKIKYCTNEEVNSHVPLFRRHRDGLIFYFLL